MTTDIPFANPHAAFAERRLEILEAVTRGLDGGQYILCLVYTSPSPRDP